ncbi:hypothetical protein FGG08_007220 [Glutinoglossum americanum]|uniref:Zn(2)-C6 fungal-type domain-containing protein n=1 Tax=Glutinoglossum americanum TaxID=1670608 RepID=A0A9P8KZL4_9PEZI|nr:hypothetical protein FGG08_007220 [Glutinoglossum americanum]
MSSSSASSVSSSSSSSSASSSSPASSPPSSSSPSEYRVSKTQKDNNGEEKKTRSRDGCQGRKVKCDEVKPSCGHCVRRDLVCDYRKPIRFQIWGDRGAPGTPTAPGCAQGGAGTTTAITAITTTILTTDPTAATPIAPQLGYNNSEGGFRTVSGPGGMPYPQGPPQQLGYDNSHHLKMAPQIFAGLGVVPNYTQALYDNRHQGQAVTLYALPGQAATPNYPVPLPGQDYGSRHREPAPRYPLVPVPGPSAPPQFEQDYGDDGTPSPSHSLGASPSPPRPTAPNPPPPPPSPRRRPRRQARSRAQDARYLALDALLGEWAHHVDAGYAGTFGEFAQQQQQAAEDEPQRGGGDAGTDMRDEDDAALELQQLLLHHHHQHHLPATEAEWSAWLEDAALAEPAPAPGQPDYARALAAAVAAAPPMPPMLGVDGEEEEVELELELEWCDFGGEPEQGRERRDGRELLVAMALSPPLALPPVTPPPPAVAGVVEAGTVGLTDVLPVAMDPAVCEGLSVEEFVRVLGCC